MRHNEFAFSNNSVGMSELRKDPARAFELARDGALVVFSHNQPVGYIVSPGWMRQALDRLADHVVTTKAVRRWGELGRARKLNPRDF